MNKKGGFSLIEILIVAAIASGVVLVVSNFQANVGVLKEIVGQKLQSRSDIDASLQIMETEMRSAGQSSSGAYAIDAAATSSFSFYSDIDKDGVFERVRYFTSTSTIRKGIIKPTGNPLVYATSSEILTTYVNNVVFVSSTPLFSYYDANYTGSQVPISSPVDITKIRIVKVSLYADINPGKSPQAAFFTTTATIRNLRSN